MKKVIIFLALTLFLISFTFAYDIKITPRVIDNPNEASMNVAQNQIQATMKTKIQEVNQIKNRLRIQAQQSECPTNCTCTGSSIKCQLRRGAREMTITAGKSGNKIVQVKGIDASTKVELFKADGKVYRTNDKNETKEVRALPDQVRIKIRERLARETQDEEIELDEEGVYQYRARKRVRLFGFIKARQKIRAEVDSETGKITKLKKPWWAFLAKDDGEEIVGAGCGTVTPGTNNECCQNKGYDSYNEEASECVFSE